MQRESEPTLPSVHSMYFFERCPARASNYLPFTRLLPAADGRLTKISKNEWLGVPPRLFYQKTFKKTQSKHLGRNGLRNFAGAVSHTAAPASAPRFSPGSAVGFWRKGAGRDRRREAGGGPRMAARCGIPAFRRDLVFFCAPSLEAAPWSAGACCGKAPACVCAAR